MDPDEYSRPFCGACGLMFDANEAERDDDGDMSCPDCGSIDIGDADDPELNNF